MENFFLSVLSSATVAGVLAVVVTVLGLHLKRPVVLHLLWLLVLVKLFVPPVFEFSLLPAASAGGITIELTEMPLNKAFQVILDAAGLTAVVDDGRVIVGKAATLGTEPNNERNPKIEGEFEGRPLYRYVEEGKISKPERIDGPNPRYPEQARKEGVNGVVEMECVIGEDGSVRDVEVVQTTADILSEAAIEAVEQWTFEPATLEGVPVTVRYIVTVKFNLR